MWYDVDMKRLARLLLPPVLRSVVMVTIVKVLTTPLRWIYAQWQATKAQTDATLGTTGNVASLEAALNGMFYLTDRQIYITEPDWTDERLALYLKKELQTATYMHMAAEGEGTQMIWATEDAPAVNFVVMVPTFLCTSTESRAADKYGWKYLTKIKATIDKYKPAGRTAGIKLYDYE